MKKIIVAVVFVAFMVIGSSVFAQDNRKEQQSEYYYKNISLEKVYPFRNGYVVQYRRGINTIDKAYLPMAWFTSPASKGEIITLPRGKVWPSMSIFYKDGAFSHVRLYVHHVENHQTWGVIPQNVDLDSAFENVDDLKIKF